MGFNRLETFLDDSTSFLSGKKGVLKEEGHNQAAFTETHKQGVDEGEVFG